MSRLAAQGQGEAESDAPTEQRCLGAAAREARARREGANRETRCVRRQRGDCPRVAAPRLARTQTSSNAMACAFGLRTPRSRLSRPGASTVLLLVVLLRIAAAQNATNATTSAPATPPPGAPPSPVKCPQGSQDDCDCTVQCCPPGEAQLGDAAEDNGGGGSFCTDKPFPESYSMRVRDRVPVQINLRDYCTDKILFSSYSAPRVDEFSLVEFPCTYSASDCNMITVPEERKMCEDGFKVYTEKLNCTGQNSFFEKFVNSRICNKANARNSREWFYSDGDPKREGQPETVGACRCNFTEPIRKKFNHESYGQAFYQKKHVEKLTEGVPDYFIKEGMSTFYVEVMIAGRSTAERGSDTECQCSSPADVSEKCMCELGTKKVPYVYNNSYVPQLTALVSMREGQLYFTNTFVKFNFDQSGKACIGCMPDYCYGVPLEKDEPGLCDDSRPQCRPDTVDCALEESIPCMPKTWRQIDFDLRLQSASVCAVPSNPDGRSGVDTSYYCRLPQTTEEVNACSLKVYMAWTGTDRYGRPLESSNMMPSKFTQMGVGNIASQFLTSSGGMIRKIDDRVSGSN